MKKIVTILSIAFCFYSCKKNLPAPSVPPALFPAGKISTTRALNYNGHFILTKSTYANNYVLTKEESKDETTGLTLTQQYYYLAGRLDYSVINNGNRNTNRVNYVYSNNRLSRMDYLEYDEQNITSLTFSRTFEYRNEHVYRIATIVPNGTPGSYEIYTFNLDNVSEVRTYSKTDELQNLIKYNYDQKLNPYIGHPEKNQSAMGYSKNNEVRVIYTDYSNANSNGDTIYSYEYNVGGYPKTKFLSDKSNISLLISISYLEQPI